MINNGRLWESVNQIAKTSASGYQSVDEWNRDLYGVQWGVISLLTDNYENNQKVSDALVNHVIVHEETTNDGGLLPLVDAGSDGEVNNYYRTVSVAYSDSGTYYPSIKVNNNERDSYQTSPIRKMDLSKNRTGYSFAENSLWMLPEQEMDVRWIYCKKPEEAILVLTEVSDEDSDYLTVDEGATTNIMFPESLFNIFKFEMLQCLGVECREDLATSYAQLGINYTTKTEIA